MKALRIAACCGLAAFALSSQAQVVIADKFRVGDDGVLFDPSTGLDWARGPTGLAGGDFGGFRLASADEVSLLFGDVGLGASFGIYETYEPDPPFASHPGPYKEAFDTLWFDWSPAERESLSRSVTYQIFELADASSAEHGLWGYLALSLPRAPEPFPFSSDYYVATNLVVPGPPGGGAGRALVRTHVSVIPEPGTYALLIAGLASLSVAFRRRRPRSPQ